MVNLLEQKYVFKSKMRYGYYDQSEKIYSHPSDPYFWYRYIIIKSRMIPGATFFEYIFVTHLQLLPLLMSFFELFEVKFVYYIKKL